MFCFCFCFFLLQLCLLNNAEQLILDDMENNPEKYEGKQVADLTDDEEIAEENRVEYAKVPYKKTVIPKTILVSSFFSTLHHIICLYIYCILDMLTWRCSGFIGRE